LAIDAARLKVGRRHAVRVQPGLLRCAPAALRRNFAAWYTSAAFVRGLASRRPVETIRVPGRHTVFHGRRPALRSGLRNGWQRHVHTAAGAPERFIRGMFAGGSRSSARFPQSENAGILAAGAAAGSRETVKIQGEERMTNGIPRFIRVGMSGLLAGGAAWAPRAWPARSTCRNRPACWPALSMTCTP
jgi:hypothetical protein